MPTVSRPMVLRVLTRLGAGGPPIHATTVTRELSSLGYASLLAAGRCDRADGDMSYLLQQDDAVTWIPEMSRNPSPWNDFKALWRLYRLMRRLRPDIVHTHTAKAGTLGRIAALLAGVPVVVHTFHGNVLSGYFPAPVSWAIQHLEALLARGSNAICVLAPQQFQEIVEQFRIAPRNKVHIIPLGMDLHPFLALEAPRPRRGTLTAGWLGRFVPIKDLPLLAAVAEAAVARNSKIRFVVAGDGPEKRLVESLRSRFPANVEFAGWQRDVVPLIGRCDVLLQTSRNEGTPVALIQAMAAGRPFVATAVGGIPDMAGERVENRQNTSWHRHGILVPHDANSFAEVLCALADDAPRIAEMGREARIFAAQRYGLPALLARLDSLYTGLLREASAPRWNQVLEFRKNS